MKEGKEIEGYAAVMWLVVWNGTRRLCTSLSAMYERAGKGRASSQDVVVLADS